MNIKEDIKIVKEFNEKNRFRDCGRLNNAIDHILEEREEDKKKIKELEVLEDDLKDKRIVYVDTPEFEEKFIAKQKVKEKLEKVEKENESYEIYNKESRMYWINEGKISLAKKLLEDK